MRISQLTKPALCAAALMVGLSGAVQAQDKSGTNASAVDAGKGGPVGQLAMAQELYAYGVENEDAISILAAARITAGISTKDVEREKRTEAPGSAVAEEGEGADAPVTADAMFRKAKEVVSDDVLKSIIDDAMAERGRGRVGGPSRTLSRLPAGYTDFFTVSFFGGQLAEIAVLGDGDADLDMLVADENGNAICLDQSYSDQIYCSFTPAWTGPFTIVVENVGRIRNSYYLLTN